MARETSFSIDDIRQAANDASSIVYDFPGRQQADERINSILDERLERYSASVRKRLASRTRTKNLAPLTEKFFDSLQNHPAFLEIEYQRTKAQELGIPPEDLIPSPEQRYDRALGVADDRLDDIIQVVLSDRELAQQFWQSTDRQVRTRSKAELARIDAKSKDPFTLDYDILIVGASIAASQLVTQIGPYFNVGVVTDKRHIAADTRFRPVFANNTADENDIYGARLPTLANGTASVSLIGSKQTIRPGQLLTPGTLKIKCNDGETRRYPGFDLFGDAAGINILSYANQVLLNQRCDFFSVDNSSLYPSIGMQDQETGQIRRIRARRIILATGPGTDKGSNPDFIRSINQKAFAITKLTDAGNADPREIASLAKLDLPSQLTLTDLTAAVEFWRCELNADDKLYPLRSIFQKDNRIVVSGGGDSAFSLREFATLKAPSFAYPRDIDLRECPSTTLVSPTYKSEDDIAKKARLRYAQNVPNDKNGRHEVMPGKVINVTKANSTIVVTASQAEKVSVVPADFYFDGTGLAKSDIRSIIPQLTRFRDPNGNSTIAYATPDYRFITAGTASGILVSEFEEEFTRLLNQIGTQENSLATFGAAIQTIRIGHYLLTNTYPNITQISQTLDLAVKQLRSFGSEKKSRLESGYLMSGIETTPSTNLIAIALMASASYKELLEESNQSGFKFRNDVLDKLESSNSKIDITNLYKKYIGDETKRDSK